MREISDEVFALTRKYKGVLWGEHGKGFRSEYVPEFFGPLYPRLQEIKAAFDPHNQLNPGKIAAPPGHELTRVDAPPTRGQFDRQIPIAVRRANEDSLHCNGNAACFISTRTMRCARRGKPRATGSSRPRAARR